MNTKSPTPKRNTLRDWIRRENTLARPKSPAVIERNERQRLQDRLAMLRERLAAREDSGR